LIEVYPATISQAAAISRSVPRIAELWWQLTRRGEIHSCRIKPRLWSNTLLADFGTVGIATYDVAPDGKRIAAIVPAETAGGQQARNHVIFLMNFFDELRRRVPTGK